MSVISAFLHYFEEEYLIYNHLSYIISISFDLLIVASQIVLTHFDIKCEELSL